jgi:Holliday junction resolvase RusA-like endonuclease
MKVIQFFVPGLPKGQPRPRAFARKMGDKFVARVYDSGTAENWKGAIAGCAKEHFPEIPTELPVALSITSYMPRPKYHFTKKGLRQEAPDVFTGKPDCDNLAKAVCDCLTICGMWKDDAQVFDLRVIKKYGDRSGAQITLEY